MSFLKPFSSWIFLIDVWRFIGYSVSTLVLLFIRLLSYIICNFIFNFFIFFTISFSCFGSQPRNFSNCFNCLKSMWMSLFLSKLNDFNSYFLPVMITGISLFFLIISMILFFLQLYNLLQLLYYSKDLIIDG